MAGRWCSDARAAIGILIACATPCAAADAPANPLFVPLVENSRTLLGGAHDVWMEELALGVGGGPRRRNPLRPRLGIDLSPAIDAIFGMFNDYGVPLREQRDERGGGLVGVQAAFSVGRDLPAVNFNLGDRPVEPLGAFYSAERGFRAAVVWPIDRFTVRLEGGEDSEFGYYGIAGVQWLHPRLPLAAGIGVPMNLRDADGDVGLIMQIRMRLD